MRLADFIEINPRVALQRGGEYLCVMMEDVAPDRCSRGDGVSAKGRGCRKWLGAD